jgi:hypothetical protein
MLRFRLAPKIVMLRLAVLTLNRSTICDMCASCQ